MRLPRSPVSAPAARCTTTSRSRPRRVSRESSRRPSAGTPCAAVGKCWLQREGRTHPDSLAERLADRTCAMGASLSTRSDAVSAAPCHGAISWLAHTPDTAQAARPARPADTRRAMRRVRCCIRSSASPSRPWSSRGSSPPRPTAPRASTLHRRRLIVRLHTCSRPFAPASCACCGAGVCSRRTMRRTSRPIPSPTPPRCSRSSPRPPSVGDQPSGSGPARPSSASVGNPMRPGWRPSGAATRTSSASISMPIARCPPTIALGSNGCVATSCAHRWPRTGSPASPTVASSARSRAPGTTHPPSDLYAPRIPGTLGSPDPSTAHQLGFVPWRAGSAGSVAPAPTECARDPRTADAATLVLGSGGASRGRADTDATVVGAGRRGPSGPVAHCADAPHVARRLTSVAERRTDASRVGLGRLDAPGVCY